jgi:hypothetical protein
MKHFERGAMRPTILDILTALILLAVLLWASWKQFPAYNRIETSTAGSVGAASRSAEKF